MTNNAKPVDFSAFHSRFRVQGTLRTETAIRIGSGRNTDPTERDLPVLKDLRGRPYIPGSSFKGAYRAHLERLLRGVNETLACPSTTRPREANSLPGCLTQGDIENLKAKFQDDPAELARQILNSSCWTCSLLGAPWLASKMLFRDMPVKRETWFERYSIRDGVAIDRDTETAATAMKYDFEAVPVGTEFQFEVVIENAIEAELGLAFLGLREFEEGHVVLGGAASRGLGKVNLEINWEKSEWLTADKLLDYFAKKDFERLDTEKKREVYWQALLTKIQSAGQEAQHA